LGGDLGHALGAALRPAILDGDGATLDPTEFVHPIQEGGDPLALDASCSRAEHPYRWQPCRLLRSRHERPCDRHAAEQRALGLDVPWFLQQRAELIIPPASTYGFHPKMEGRRRRTAKSAIARR